MCIVPIIGFSVLTVLAFGLFPVLCCNDNLTQWQKFFAFLGSLLSGLGAMYFLIELLQRTGY